VTGSPRPGNSSQLAALAAAWASHLAVAIKMMLPFYYHRMQSSKNGRASKSELSSFFTGSQYFSQDNPHGGGSRFQSPGGKIWLCGDYGMAVTGQGNQNGEPYWLTSHNSPSTLSFHNSVTVVLQAPIPRDSKLKTTNSDSSLHSAPPGQDIPIHLL
jgi:uncharacterized protein YqjF (DUF2071 family)